MEGSGDTLIVQHEPKVRARVLPFLSAAYRVARVSPFRVLRGRRLLALILLAYSPVLVVLLMRIFGATSSLGVGGFVDGATSLYITVIFPVTLLFLGAAAIGDEIDNGTLLYLRLRPVGRGAIVCGRYFAATLSSVVLLAPPLILLYLIQVGARGSALLHEQLPLLFVMLGDVVLASLSYGALFLLFSLLLRHAVITGVFFVLGWEVFVSAVIPSKAALATVSFHLRAILWNETHEGGELAGQMTSFDEAGTLPSTFQSGVGLLVATLVLLALACWVFRTKEYIERPGDA
ncbi:MAG: ABC transporter permease subunit [Planctomycetota bacterium]